MRKKYMLFAISTVLLFSGCNHEFDKNDTEQIMTSETIVTTVPTTTKAPVTTIPKAELAELTPENYPLIDGIASSISLNAHIRAAALGISYEEAENSIEHDSNKTSAVALHNGEIDAVFEYPETESYYAYGTQTGQCTRIPVCRKGLVFVVNADNPVDSLTSEQIRKIYSGEITNWSEVGGNDAEIRVFQRNEHSAAYSYMEEFMGEYEQCDPVTEISFTDIQNYSIKAGRYDNGIDSIGYSIYASDSERRFENMKFIAVDSVKPSEETLIDGTYPAYSHLYFVFRSNEPSDSPVRSLADFIQSEEGQDAVERAGMIRTDGKKKGLYVNNLKPYTQVGTGKKRPDEYNMPNYYYYNDDIENITDAQAYEMVSEFINQSTDELYGMIGEFSESDFTGFNYKYDESRFSVDSSISCVNQYCTAVVKLKYCYNDIAVRIAYFNLAEHKQMELSDFYYEGVNFMGYINDEIHRHISVYDGADENAIILRDPECFTGMYENCLYINPCNTGAMVYIPYFNPYCDKKFYSLHLNLDSYSASGTSHSNLAYEIADKTVIFEGYDVSNLYRDAKSAPCPKDFYFGTAETSLSYVMYPVKSRLLNDSQLKELQKAVIDSAEKIIDEENPMLQIENQNMSGYMADYYGINVFFQPDENRFVFKSGPIFPFPDNKYYLDIYTLEFYTE